MVYLSRVILECPEGPQMVAFGSLVGALTILLGAGCQMTVQQSWNFEHYRYYSANPYCSWNIVVVYPLPPLVTPPPQCQAGPPHGGGGGAVAPHNGSNKNCSSSNITKKNFLRRLVFPWGGDYKGGEGIRDI